MTGSPTQFIVPNADNTPLPLGWVMPTSVAPAYLGVFGGSAARTLQNGAVVNAAPSTVIGTAPPSASGYTTFTGDPAAAIQTNQTDALNWTLMTIAWAPALASGVSAVVWGGQAETTTGNNLFVFFDNQGGTLEMFVQQKLVGGSTISGFGAVNIESNFSVPNLICLTGQSGVGSTSQNLTAGASPGVVSIASATAFETGTLGAQIGTSGGGASFPGSFNCAILGFWTSVLSTQDIALAAAWMRKIAAKQGVTV